MSLTATATPRFTNTRPTANYCCRGASPAAILASSTSSTTSAPMPTVGSMSPTVRTTGSRYSTATGKYETQWNNLHRPCGLYMDYVRHPVCYIGELSVNRLNANLGPRVSIVDNQGKLLSRIGDPFAGTAPTSFIGPHGLAADSHGDLYVGEVCWTLWPGVFPGQPHPP